MHVHVVHCEIIGVEHWNITQRCNNGIYGNVRVKSAIPFKSQYTTAFLTSPASTQDFGAHRIRANASRVKSGIFGNQVNSDIHLQTVEIQMRRLLIRIFIQLCLFNIYFYSNLKYETNKVTVRIYLMSEDTRLYPCTRPC